MKVPQQEGEDRAGLVRPLGMERAMVVLCSITVNHVASRRLVLRKRSGGTTVCRQQAGRATATSYNLCLSGFYQVYFGGYVKFFSLALH